MDKERNIKISFKKAKEWYYNSYNPTLKELALQAYTKAELERNTFNQILAIIGEVPVTKEEEILAILAAFYKRKEDVFKVIQDKYFIAQTSDNTYSVLKHMNVLYPGIPYFLRKADAEEALEIFLEEI